MTQANLREKSVLHGTEAKIARSLQPYLEHVKKSLRLQRYFQHMPMHSLSVSGYTIYLGALTEALPALWPQGRWSAIAIVCDENTYVHCWPLLQPLLPAHLAPHLIVIPAGEVHKNVHTCTRIWEDMLRASLERSALVINLGGGVVGDMGGFCAATFKRGLDFMQIPTTLLAQVDASIGGKLGIDFGGVKNSVGVFQHPYAVCIDPVFLRTLPARELRSGFAEVIKHALIADAEQWEALRYAPLESAVRDEAVIFRSLRVKQAIVEADPFEKGLRKALNFGHTVGHAVEAWALDSPSPLLHGEAIAVGMVAEAFLSHLLSSLPETELEAIVQFIRRVYPLPVLPEACFDQLIALMRQDKKNTGGRISFALLPAIGQVRIDGFADEAAIREALHWYNTIL